MPETGFEQRILVVDDEPRYRRLISTNLHLAGYLVEEAADGAEALATLRSHPCDLVVLDLRLPDMDGYEVCRRIRQESRVPVVMVTALDTEAEMIQGLDFGADDYVVKPFRPETLLARIRAVLRRSRGGTPEAVSACGSIALDPVTREVVVRGERKPLTATEWRLMSLFVSQCGHVLTHDYLLARAWGPEYQDDVEYLRVYVRRLRHLIEVEPRHPRHLVTRAGIGYVLRDE
ncbi:MAG: response regulator transcription factor [Clostridia bacterium]